MGIIEVVILLIWLKVPVAVLNQPPKGHEYTRLELPRAGGDFNDLLSQQEKQGGNLHTIRRVLNFQQFVSDYELMGIEAKGARFTWCNQRIGGNHVKERLDRALCNDIRTPKAFEFEAVWASHPEFVDIIKDCWQIEDVEGSNGVVSFINCLNSCRVKLIKWSKEKFPNNRKLIANLIAKIEDLKAEVYTAESKCNIERLTSETTVVRRQQNLIVKLKDNLDNWIEKEDEIESLIADFYSSLFTSSPQGHFDTVIYYIQPRISDFQNQLLTQPISKIEVKEATFQLGAFKAPGPDGFNGHFYHVFWNEVRVSLLKMARSFFKNGDFVGPLNETNLILIPKVDVPKMVSQFRPISLCNFAYKIIAKVLANRLRVVLDSCISEHQRAFVPNRLIQDNSIIVHEAFYYLKNKNFGDKFELALKMDMNKAYDRLEWNFIEEVMLKRNFYSKWVNWIMNCVRSVKFNIQMSGRKIASVIPQRGLRQGDPLSPYLFILASKALFSMISFHSSHGNLSGINITKGGPMITHSLFADDTIIFLKANLDNCSLFMKLLQDYCNVSGQRVNYDKSSLFFSKNTPNEVRTNIVECLNIAEVDNPGKYLGLPILWGKSKNAALAYVCERMGRKVQGWRKKCLSFAGHGNKIHWTSWKALTKSKKEGGLGFKDFMGFNNALLAKTAWRILHNPDSLWVGTRHYIDVWKDPWIPGMKKFKMPLDNAPSINEDMVVAQLIQDRQWNLHAISNLVEESVLKCIREIPLSSTPRDDSLLWAPAKNGIYNVRAGYKLSHAATNGRIMATRASVSRKVEPSIWSAVWKLKVIPKIRSFIWRILNNALASKDALFKRKCATNPVCPVCGDDTETLEHFFLLCEWVKVAWLGSVMGLNISPLNIQNISFWLEQFLLMIDTELDYGKAYISTMLWSIWKLRCKWIFEQVLPKPEETIEMTNRTMQEYWNANSLLPKVPSYVMPKASFKWRKPQANSFKINCDDAFNNSNGRAGIGVVCRNSEGLFIKGWAEKVSAQSAFQVELLAALKVVSLATQWQHFPVIIEMDCKDLFSAITQKYLLLCPWLLQGLLAKLFAMVNDRSSICFSLIPREGNAAADFLAAIASKELGPNSLILVSPPPLADIIFHEATVANEFSFDQHVEENDREGTS
ncbi:uncharacterized protein LOC114713907 [Neltuma alba]|uniref:uncharacterized protein LOC114713907 n=1 Tax=Neltuma alba TaxID=207710 RepID=UPI0010A3A9FF|nr:uncharacterized protein LOC114713907 [Prosopis alba]